MEPFFVTPQEALGQDNVPSLNSLGFDYNAPHVVYPPTVSSGSSPGEGVLQVCLFGTGTRPDQSSIYLRCLHELAPGVPTIGLCYKFGPIPDVKRNKRIFEMVGGDETELQKRIEFYHEDILFGGSKCGLDFINVSKEDSIINRLTALVTHLERTRPKEEDWDRFFKEATKFVDLSKIMFTGYSQGAGHLCYLAKTEVLGGLIMVSGPQDPIPSPGSGATSWLNRGNFATRNMVAWKHVREETGAIMDLCWRLIEPLGLGEGADSRGSVDCIVNQESVSLQKIGDRCFHVNLDPQAGFTGNDRPCHCSTLIDAAAPVSDGGESVYSMSIYPLTIKLCLAGIRRKSERSGAVEASKL